MQRETGLTARQVGPGHLQFSGGSLHNWAPAKETRLIAARRLETVICMMKEVGNWGFWWTVRMAAWNSQDRRLSSSFVSPPRTAFLFPFKSADKSEKRVLLVLKNTNLFATMISSWLAPTHLLHSKKFIVFSTRLGREHAGSPGVRLQGQGSTVAQGLGELRGRPLEITVGGNRYILVGHVFQEVMHL